MFWQPLEEAGEGEASDTVWCLCNRTNNYYIRFTLFVAVGKFI